MKTSFLTILLCILSLILGCAEFPTSYERIEPKKARMLDFMYEPAEAAPGDTVVLTAVFAGKEIGPDELTWKMSKRLVINEYGAETALDTENLDLTLREYSFSENTSTVSFSFVIPPDILKKSPIIPEKWIERLPEYFQDAIPEPYRSMTKSEILTMVDNLSNPSSGALQDIDESTIALLPTLLQCFTVPIRFFCTYDNGHKIYSDYTIRYNHKFSGIPRLGIPFNRNPTVDSIVLYTVDESPLNVFDPENTDYEYTQHTLSDTVKITVNKNKSYFLKIFTGNVDTTLSIDAAMGASKPLPENHFTEWYFLFDDEDVEKVAPSKLFNIEAGNLLVQLYPPAKSAPLTCRVWLEVTDSFINEFFRPIGSTLKEMYFEFSYDR